MKNISFAILATSIAHAGNEAPVVSQPESRIQPFALTESAFSFDAGYEDGGSGSAFEFRARTGLLFPLPEAPLPGRAFGEWKLRVGVDWHRFEFDHSGGLPLPERLQSVSGIIGIELHSKGRIGALLQVRPGVYFEDQVGSNAWNFPVLLGIGYDVSDRFSLALMGRYDGFASNPFIGGIGFVWRITDAVTLSAIGPEPRITWRIDEQLSIWAGGEFGGGNFRSSQLDDAVVDYTDYRVYLGTTWKTGGWKFEIAAGASLEREWDYHKADKTYQTDEASPFLKVSAGTKW